MNEYTILCDVDGVLADLVTPLCAEISRYDATIRPEDIKHFDFKLSMSPSQCEIAKALMSQAGFCYGLPAYEGALAFLDQLDALGSTLFVTAPYPSPTWVAERQAWLVARGCVPQRVLSVSSEFKPYVRGDVLIEDRPGTLAAWLDANPEGHGILMNRPWNTLAADEYVWHPRTCRAFSFTEALSFIHVFKAERAGVCEYRQYENFDDGAAA
jgi:5'(3')-deoxyribonucleotidase